ncbi:MAG: redox-regulated ATPase YchF [Bacteroidales bacterium]|nr:redox-regulated ATPase YchF [Bacteroidales bacterium]
MALTCGIIGLSNIGKTTIFNCVSNTKAEISSFAFSTNKSNVGMVNVIDPRMDAMNKLVNSQKLITATVDLVDIPGLTKGASQGEGVGNKFLADIQQTNALIHVLRCFDDENLPHIEGSVDPVRDKEIVEFELQVRDLDLVERKIQRLEKLAKSGEKTAKHGLEVLSKLKAHLENMLNVRDFEVSADDKKSFINDMYLLTDKPVLYVCNVDDSSAVHGNKYVDQLKAGIEDKNAQILIIAGALEAEIADLEDPEDRKEFLSDAGLEEPGVNKLVRAAYKSLNLHSFFTVGPKEIHAWTLKKGMKAPEAAGVIHSDLERGFIRAEVMHYEDFIALGSEAACRDKGKLFIEGKNYEVADGDILNIRFNV